MNDELGHKGELYTKRTDRAITNLVKKRGKKAGSPFRVYIRSARSEASRSDPGRETY